MQLRAFVYFAVAGLLPLSVVESVYGVEEPIRTEFAPSALEPFWQSPRAVSQAASVEIVDVQIVEFEDGIDVILETSEGQLSQPVTSAEGNTFIANIPNSVLAGDTFRAENPAAGFALVEVAQLDDQLVRVSIVGTEILPDTDIAITQQGLTLSAFDTVAGEPGALGEPADAEAIRILVTAEKQPDDVQDIPISITALTAEEIEDADITSLEQVAGATPNFTAYTPGRNFLLYSVRGLSNFNFLSRDPVAFYIDDVPYDYTGFLDLELTDLERVEVLRGPQATLYGRNAEAGVVNIVTRRPTNVPEYSFTSALGNFSSPDLRASASGPLIADKLFYRLSGDFKQRDGFLVNTVTDEDVDFESGGGGRAQLMWTPSENWEVLFNAAIDSYRDGTPPISRPDLGQDPSETDINAIGFNNLDTNSQSLRVTYENPSLRFTSITGRRFSDQEFENDSDGTSLDQLEQFVAIDSTVFSQELRLQSATDDGPFSWLTGAYYEQRDFNVGEEGFIIGADLGGPLVSVNRAEIDEDTYAVFGQASYRPTEALTLTAGLRYEIFDSTLESSEAESVLGIATFNDESNNGDELIPRVAVEYKVTPDVMVYGSISRGYRAQGVNFRATVPEQLFFDAEKSWNYEVGVRSSWFEDRLTANLTLFHNPIDDYQVPSTDPATGLFGFVDNAGVTINGLEAELRARPIDGLDLIAGFGWLDAEYTDYVDPILGNFNGNNLTYSPEYTFNLAAQYRSTDGIFGRLEAQGFGTTYFNDDNSLRQRPYVLVNARLGYEFNQNQGIYVFANNIFDFRAFTTTASFFGGSLFPSTYIAPATFGVQYRTRF
ncbi:MAG: TonB-dependent receptor [Cyanobacteria bacterium P01_D01_bin.44]